MQMIHEDVTYRSETEDMKCSFLLYKRKSCLVFYKRPFLLYKKKAVITPSKEENISSAGGCWKLLGAARVCWRLLVVSGGIEFREQPGQQFDALPLMPTAHDGASAQPPKVKSKWARSSCSSLDYLGTRRHSIFGHRRQLVIFC